jgi:hypothetical protein
MCVCVCVCVCGLGVGLGDARWYALGAVHIQSLFSYPMLSGNSYIGQITLSGPLQDGLAIYHQVIVTASDNSIVDNVILSNFGFSAMPPSLSTAGPGLISNFILNGRRVTRNSTTAECSNRGFFNGVTCDCYSTFTGASCQSSPRECNTHTHTHPHTHPFTLTCT